MLNYKTISNKEYCSALDSFHEQSSISSAPNLKYNAGRQLLTSLLDTAGAAPRQNCTYETRGNLNNNNTKLIKLIEKIVEFNEIHVKSLAQNTNAYIMWIICSSGCPAIERFTSRHITITYIF